MTDETQSYQTGNVGDNAIVQQGENLNSYQFTLHLKDEKDADALLRRFEAKQGAGLPLDRPLQTRRCDFYYHISPPARYVSRTEVLEAVRSALLADLSDAVVSSPSNGPLALHGMGGIGKSIIARALCDDLAVQTAFPDGILWVTLGKKPELVQEMRNWVQTLGGTISENAPTVDSLKNLLAKLFRDRSCLLILDDVWRRRHAEAFFVGGPRCRMLLTTRDAAIADELGAEVRYICAMTEPEAIMLLEAWSNGHLAGADSNLKRQIVKRLGCLPLAVKLAGAQLRRKQASEWLRTFAFRNLKSSRSEDIHDNLELTYNLSLEELNKDPRALRRLYVSLAIFREDEATPQAAIERLWSSYDGCDAESTADILDDLAARALLDVTSYGSAKVVRLHDLLHDLVDMELNDGRIAAHQALLKAYYEMREGDGWHTVDDDGYLYDHLTYHLHAAGAIDELKGLFANQHWLQRRIQQRDYTYDGYLSDLALVWKHADAEARQQIKANQEPADFADCMRYLLIQTSINGLAGNYSPELVIRAVEAGLWSSRRALSIAAKIPDEGQRGKMCAALLKTTKLSKEQREEAQRLGLEAVLTLLQTGEYTTILAKFFAELAPQLTEEELKRALETALAISDEWGRAGVLTLLAPHLPEEMREQVLEAALTISEEGRARVLAALALQVTGEMQEQILKAAIALSGKWGQAEVLVALAPHLVEERRTQILEIVFKTAMAFSDEGERARMLKLLAPQVTQKMQGRVLAAALAITDEWKQAEVLAALAPQMTGERQERVLAAALAITNEQRRAEVLAALVQQMTGEKHTHLLDRTLEAALAISDQWRGAEVLAALAPHLPEERQERALEAALSITDEWKRAEVLTALAPHLSEEWRPQVLEWALEAALAHSDERLLAALAPYLPVERRTQALEEVLEEALSITSERDRAQVLATLAPHLPEERRTQVLEWALEAALAISNEDALALWMVVDVLAPQVMGEMLEQILQAALVISYELGRAQTLAALAPWLTERQLERVLEAAMALSDERDRTDVMIAVLPFVPDQVQLLQSIRQTMLDDLLSMQSWSRKASLDHMFSDQHFRPSVFSSETLAVVC